jgi:monofunctional biosynthetic peptidoglycan transglycosylase
MEKTIIDFSSPDEQDRWEIINDVVMGGVSSSRISLSGNKLALFYGEVSLENYGGFASLRTHLREFNLKGYMGLIVRIKGDGKSYRLRLRTDDSYEGIAYQSPFSTEQDKWMIVRLPFNAFTPVFRGRVIKDAPPLDISAVRRIGFMIADKQAGPFHLEIEWVKAYS